MASRILIIEDEPDIRKTLEYNFSKESFEVFQAASIAEGEQAIVEHNPDIVILDLMLPDGSGLTLCRDIKSDPATKHLPVILLTAKADEVDRVVGFELGADDYVTKPFSVRELILRVKAILKRTSQSNQDQENLIFNEIKINTVQKKAYRGDRRLNLGPTEFNILFFLLKNKQRVFSREQILNKIWPNQVNVELRTVDVHIRRLRKELNKNEEKDIIRTVRSAGYSLDFDE